MSLSPTRLICFNKPYGVLSQFTAEGRWRGLKDFIDLPGVWQHFTLPAQELEESAFEEGLGFDGSSIRGFQQIQEDRKSVV